MPPGVQSKSADRTLRQPSGGLRVRVQSTIEIDLDEGRLARVAAKTLHSEGKGEGKSGESVKSEEIGLSLVITDDRHIRELNRRFRGVDAPTDVLAFPLEREGERGEEESSFIVAAEASAPYLGDVVISYPRAVLQAQEYGHSLERELSLLIIHGVLHLLGYDHADEEERARMWARQDDILRQLKY